jgi:hypothetical protein
MSNQTHTRPSRTRQLPAAARGTLSRYGSRRRDAAYAARVDYTAGLVSLRSR